MNCSDVTRYLAFGALSLSIFSCNNGDQPADNGNSGPSEPAPALINYNVVNTYPHDTSFFTEGLEFYNGTLYESSGGLHQETPHPSAFGAVDLKTGKVQKKVELDNKVFFGEGITFMNGYVYQLTYKSQKGFVYDAKNFRKIKEFSYAGEGWALTHDSTRLIMSNGSSNIQFLDPTTLAVTGSISVTDNNGPVSNINELEFVNGVLYANQWQTNYILKIDPGTGKVTGKIDLSRLADEIRRTSPSADVANGIAYNPASKTFFVTGKLWPKMYEIRLD